MKKHVKLFEAWSMSADSGSDLFSAIDAADVAAVQQLLSSGADPSQLMPMSPDVTDPYTGPNEYMATSPLKLALALYANGYYNHAVDYSPFKPEFLQIIDMLIGAGANLNHVGEGYGYEPIDFTAALAEISWELDRAVFMRNVWEPISEILAKHGHDIDISEFID